MADHSLLQPFQLLPTFHERVWGRRELAPFLANPTGDTKLIGEVWFSASDNTTSLGGRFGQLLERHPRVLGTAAPAGQAAFCPLLVKLLYTSSRLSVQVHPDDDYARIHHDGALGKTEAWYVLDAQPGAEVAVGFRHCLEPDRLRSAALSGEIEQLLDWRPVAAGDVILTPAGTVHAIGAGVTICEIQQNSDITYRLYDYGRPRQLHLDHGCRVSRLTPHQGTAPARMLEPWRHHLVECEHFRVEKLTLTDSLCFDLPLPHYALLIALQGAGTIAERPFAAGQTWFVPAGAEPFAIDGAGSEWLLTYTAPHPAELQAELPPVLPAAHPPTHSPFSSPASFGISRIRIPLGLANNKRSNGRSS